MLQPQYSRQRQQAMLKIVRDRQLDCIVLGLSHHVYYASTHRPFWLNEAAFVLFSDGRTWLMTANSPNTSAVADEIVAYEASWMGTQRQEQPAVIADAVLQLLKDRKAKRIGIDASAVTSQVVLAFDGESGAIDSELWQLRRSKWLDELDLMKTAIRCTEAMYARAKQIIEPGIPELDIFNELHAVAVKTAGEQLSAHLGNDFASGVGGGPARDNQRAEAGHLYVLDLGPAVRGYFADNCRAFSVDRKPTDDQMKAWETVVGSFPIIETMAKPGVRCRDLFAAVDQHFQKSAGKSLAHHLGHGVGLQPHEFPHLNLKWDDVLIEGEIFTAEPGLYGPAINGGIRIENQYLVTKTGVENLVDFPLSLT